MREFGAQNEYSKLREVLMHIPGDEICLINGENRNEYLFREVPDPERFREEHVKFIEVLKSEGIEVQLVEEILKNTDYIEIIEMCPNMIFIRDTGTITKIGAIIGRMSKIARHAEPLIVKEALKKLNVPVALEIKSPGEFEGGDAVWLDERTLMIGYATRTNEEAVKQIANLLLKEEIVEKVIAVPLPRGRVHLDGGLMILSPTTAVTRIEAISTYPSKIISANEVKLINLAEWLKRKGYELITVTEREDRIFGANLVAIGENKVLSYVWNRRIMRELEKRGFDVLGIEGYELVKGGGGLHCMILPIRRD